FRQLFVRARAISEPVDREVGVGDDVEGAFADEVGVGFDGAGGAVVYEGGAADRVHGHADVFSRADDLEDAAAGGDGETDGDVVERFSRERRDGENAGDVAVGSVGECVGLPGRLDALVGVHGENFEVRESVGAIVAAAGAFGVDAGGLRQPEFLSVRVEADGLVLDRNALLREADLLDGLNQLGFQAHDLIRGSVNPGAALQRNRNHTPSHAVLAHAVGPILALDEVNLPGRMPFP